MAKSSQNSQIAKLAKLTILAFLINFVFSKCKPSSLRSQCWMRFSFGIFKHCADSYFDEVPFGLWNGWHNKYCRFWNRPRGIEKPFRLPSKEIWIGLEMYENKILDRSQVILQGSAKIWFGTQRFPWRFCTFVQYRHSSRNVLFSEVPDKRPREIASLWRISALFQLTPREPKWKIK